MSPTQQEQSAPTATTSSSALHSPIPRGFTVVHGPDFHQYLVPEFLAPWTQDALEIDYMRQKLESESANREVSFALQHTISSDPRIPSRI